MTQLNFFKHSTVQKMSLDIPKNYAQHTVKCRISYNETNYHFAFANYTPRSIQFLKLIEDNRIKYDYKYEDRTEFELLAAQLNSSEEMLIVQNGYITDTSFSNIVFFDGDNYYTPKTFLLNGVQRQYLLASKQIKELTIKAKDIEKFSTLFLINAMLDWQNKLEISTKNIINT